MLGAVLLSLTSLNPIIEAASSRHGVPTALTRAVIKVESNYDPNARRYEAHLNDSSWGLMQVLLKTARWIRKEQTLTASTLVKPSVNVNTGTMYLGWLLQKYSNLKDVIAAYNAGSPRKTGEGKYVNQRYVDKVWRQYIKYKSLEAVTGAPGVASLIAVGVLGYVTLQGASNASR